MVRKVILTSLFIVFLVLVVLIMKHYFRMQAEMKADGESRSSDGIVHEGSSFNPEIDFITNMAADPNLSLFADVLLDVGPDAIPGTGPFTVFAPINNAMLPFISSQPTRSQKIDLVRHHVVASEYRYEDFIDGCRLETIGLDVITCRTTEKGVLLQESVPVLGYNLYSTNGITHSVGALLY